jgi:hypothetical protein
MKKSKVIIPAMALLLFSTAASVTGTVAWFSSTRVFNTSAANFGINTVDGNLTATLQARVGTALDGADKIKSDTNCRLYHGSFNALTSGDNLNKAYILNQEPDGSGNDVYEDKGTETASFGTGAGAANAAWHVRTAKDSPSDPDIKYFVAFSWKITFNYTMATGESKYGIFLDLDKSSFVADDDPIRSAEISSGAVRYDEKTQIGLRIAFIPSAGATSAKVFGNNPGPESDVTKLKYVKGRASTDTANYATTNYMVHNGSYKRHANSGETPAEGQTVAAASQVDCLYTATAASTDVICVAWYEGEDANVISRAQMDNVKANLSFYVRAVDPAA